jgi:multiple sugar transport system permease protein
VLLRLVPLLLVLPSLLLAGFVILYPLWELVMLSVHDVNRFGGVQGFSGPANALRVLGDPLFFQSLARTLEWTALVVGGTVLISTPVALVLNQDFIGRGVARTIIMLPWAVSLTMIGVVWRWALNSDYGLLNTTLQEIGAIGGPVPWLATAGTAFPMEVAIGILVSIPFTVTLYLGGLSAIPGELYEAARVDGAGAWQEFRHITLPLLRPFVNMAIVLNMIYVFNSFPIIWVLTQGGPANSTDILVTYLYKLAFRFGRLGDAAAVSLAMFAILLAFTLVYLRMAVRDTRTEV